MYKNFTQPPTYEKRQQTLKEKLIETVKLSFLITMILVIIIGVIVKFFNI